VWNREYRPDIPQTSPQLQNQHYAHFSFVQPAAQPLPHIASLALSGFETAILLAPPQAQFATQLPLLQVPDEDFMYTLVFIVLASPERNGTDKIHLHHY
jgi:hypothetical protein